MRLSLLLFAFAGSLFSCAGGHQIGFDNDRPAVRELTAYNDELRSLAESSASVSLDSIGTVDYPGFTADLLLLAYTPKYDPVKTILVTGGVHGNEPAGAAFTLDLVRALSEGSLVYDDIRVEIIPLINPWGWSRDSRHNFDGRDINRDFASFKAQEAAIVRDYISGKSFDLVIDHHEDGNASGVYMYQYSKSDRTAARTILEEVRTNGYPLERDVSMIILKTDDGLIYAPMWGLQYMRLTRQLSITNYIRLESSKAVYTVETPMNLPMEERIAIHRFIFERFAE